MLGEIWNIIVNTVGVGLVALAIYLVYYFVKKYNLERWVKKAVHAAEILFDAPDTQEKKKEWVKKFLKTNLNLNGISDEQLDCMIEAAVEMLNISQQGSLSEKDVFDIVSKYFGKQLQDTLDAAKETKSISAETIIEAASTEVATEK